MPGAFSVTDKMLQIKEIDSGEVEATACSWETFPFSKKISLNLTRNQKLVLLKTSEDCNRNIYR